MGLYDRDYGRHSEPGVHLGAPKTITNQLVMITVGVYVLQLLIPEFTNWFRGTSDWYKTPWQFYRLLTYGFLHASEGFSQNFGVIQHLAFNMLMLWMFGNEIERKYGRREYLLFYLWAIVFAGLFWSLSESSMGRQAALVGASGGISGIFVLFALNYPHRQVLFMFIIPLPMWVVALFVIGMDINGAIQRSGGVAFTAHLAGSLAGLYYFKFNISPFRWLADRLPGFSLKMPGKRPNLRIHEPTEGDSELDRQVDAILKKINNEGQDSLTNRERKLLEKASRKYQRDRE